MADGYDSRHVLQVLDNPDIKFGYNAATDKYQDLMAGGIIDPTKVTHPPTPSL